MRDVLDGREAVASDDRIDLRSRALLEFRIQCHGRNERRQRGDSLDLYFIQDDISIEFEYEHCLETYGVGTTGIESTAAPFDDVLLYSIRGIAIVRLKHTRSEGVDI